MLTDNYFLPLSYLIGIICVNIQSAQEEAIDITTLTTYVSYARKNIHPKLSDEAAEELTRGYVELRKAGKFAGSSKKVCPRNFNIFSMS